MNWALQQGSSITCSAYLSKTHPLPQYGCANTDTVFRLTRRLIPELVLDERHYRCYELIQMPALRMFVDVERRGIQIDINALQEFSDFLIDKEQEMYDALLGDIPPSIRKKWMDPKKPRHGLSFKRDGFIADFLFEHVDGKRFEPKILTPTKKPSVAAKTHLPWFEDDLWVAQFIEWTQVNTLLTNFVGKESSEKHGGNSTGIWQYVAADGCIHPSYWLHRTVTGRTASSDPNGQNIPKRSELAMEFRKIFVPRPGYSLLELDLSQAELRFAAWMANETNMIRLYKQGEDIHANTGAAIAGIPLGKFKQGANDERLLIDCANEWKGSGHFLQVLSSGKRKTVKVKEYIKHLRQCAKAVLMTNVLSQSIQSLTCDFKPNSQNM